MGFWNTLKKINDKVNNIENKKNELKDLADDSKRTDEDRRDIKRAKIWMTFNIIFSLGTGVALCFLIRMFLDFSIMSFFAVVIFGALGFAMGTSIRKAQLYAEDHCESIGTRILNKVSIAVLTVAVIAGFFAGIFFFAM